MNLRFIAIALLFTFFCSEELSAQCPQGDVILTTQAEVIGFKRQYPNCTAINGQLTIGERSSDIHDLSPLANIQSIDSSIIIRECILLEDMEALNNLSNIGGSVNIYNLEKLREITFLRNFKEFNYLNLTNLPSLKNLEDIAHIEHIENRLQLSNLNTPLPSEGALRSIKESIFIYNCQNLTDLDFFSKLDSTLGIYIEGCFDLEDISGLNNISSDIELSVLTFINNTKLNLCATERICNAITQDSTWISLINNGPDCSDLNLIIEACGGTFPECPSESVTLSGQSQLELFASNYPNCKTIEHSLSIISTLENEVISLSPLGYIATIEGSLSIHNNFQLIDLSGLEGLNSIGSLSISTNDNLESLNGLQQLKKLNRLSLINNNSIRDISAINFDGFILENVTLIDNITLPDISPLGNVDTIRSLNLRNNHAISNLNQLDGIQYIENFYIQERHGFTSIDDDFLSPISIGNFDISGIDNITRIDFGNSINIDKNLLITRLNNLKTLKLNSYSNSIEQINIRSNDVLESIDFGNGPTNVNKYVWVISNPLLTTINLPIETEFINQLAINTNYELTNINGGDNLTRMAELNVINNANLKDLSGFNYPIIIDSIKVLSNRELDDCAIEPFCLIPELKHLTVSHNKGPCESSVIAIGHCPQNIKNPFTDVVITSFDDLITLRNTYPNADSIHGNLTFDGVADISIDDLDYFQQIKYLDANLAFRDSDIESLDDFGHMQFKNLEIKNCNRIKSLTLFNNLFTADNIIISSNDSLVSLQGLDSLAIVEKLELIGNAGLSSLKGLENLKSISSIRLNSIPIPNLNPLARLEHMGYFDINNCDNLNTLKGLEKLKSVIGGNIWNNDALRSLFNTIPIDTLHSGLYISKNYLLEEISGFENVNHINSYLRLSDANGLINLNTFPLLETTGNIFLYNNDLMSSFEFPKLKEMRSLEVNNNQSLETFGDLSQLNLLTQKLEIRSNIVLEDIGSLSDSLEVGYIEFLTNPLLDDCSLPFICEHLKKGKKINFVKNSTNCITEAVVENQCDFTPKKCPSIGYVIDGDLTSQVYNDNYSNCRVLNGDLDVMGNIELDPQLQNLNVTIGKITINSTGLESVNFENLDIVSRDFSIVGTRDLVQVNLPKLTNVGAQLSSNTNNFRIIDNLNLISIPALDNLMFSNIKMLISENSNLTSISGLNGIEEFNSLEIYDNLSLIEIIGFNQLVSVNELLIYNNENLSNVEAFDHIFDADYITVYDNPNLSFCSVKGFCHHVDNDREHDFYDNLTGCNSRDEILEKCTLSVFDSKENELDINVYPNPTDGLINISTALEVYQIRVLDIQGQLCDVNTFNNIIDLSNLNSGIFMLFIHTSEGISKHKVMLSKL